jgi:hypothetical protein
LEFKVEKSKELHVRRGFPESPDPASVAEELYEMIAPPDIAPAMFFCDPEYNRDA